MAKRIDKDLARYALQGIEAALEKMQRQAAELRRLVGGASKGGRGVDGTSGAVAEGAQPGRRRRRKWTMSAEARKRISDAQKARWAKHRAGTKSR